MYLILKVPPFHDLKSGQFYLNQKNTEIVLSKFPGIQKLAAKDIKRAFAFYNGKNMDSKVYSIIVNNIAISTNGISIRYNIVLKNEEYFNSTLFSKSLYYYLISEGKIKKEEFMPNIILLDNNGWLAVLNNMNKNDLKKDEDDIGSMFAQNNWEGIYNKFKPIENIDRSKYWNNHEILSMIGFAISKLSYLSDADKECLNNIKKKEKILKEKKKLREEAEFIFKRCIEIDKENKARYLSNIAYINYHYLQDAINNRKFKLESTEDLLTYFNKAERYFKDALKLDDTRIKEWYRLGYLMLECYGKIVVDTDEVFKRQMEGIDYLRKVINLWRELSEDEKKRCKYEYINSLYNISKFYQEALKSFWSNVKRRLQGNLLNTNLFSKNHIDPKQGLCYAKEYLEECFKDQYEQDINEVIDKITHEDIMKTYDNWKIEAIDLLYRLGLLYFMIYWYLIDINCKDIDKLNSYINKSKKCYELSLKLNWKENKSMQRDFIEERFARLYITIGQYDKAINLLEKYRDKYKDKESKKYILDTLDLAVYLNIRKRVV